MLPVRFERFPVRFERMIDDLMTRPFGSVLGVDKTFGLAMDIAAVDNNYEVTMDIPGVSRDRIVIEMEGKVLRVEVKEPTRETNQKTYLVRERTTGSAVRTCEFGDVVDFENAKANFDNGVLTITIPRKDVSPKRTLALD